MMGTSQKLHSFFVFFLTLILPGLSIAASIDPAVVNVSLVPGQTVNLQRSVILDETGPAASRVDVMFLADNTGSMGGVIGTVRNNAQVILDAISGGDLRFAGIDVQFGVASYNGDPREFGGSADVRVSRAYQLRQPVTDSRDAVTSAIGQWRASGGGDGPEANFFALHQIATDGGVTDGNGSTDPGYGSGLATGWRDGAAKVIVWFGDIVSHTTTVNLDEVITVLTENDVIVAAINTRGANSGIDGSGQASQIVAATNGSLTNNVVGTQSTVDAILNAVEQATDTVDIDLVAEGLAAGLEVTYQCISAQGCSDVAAGESREFSMQIHASGAGPGVYSFNTVVPQITGLITDDIISVRECVNDITARAKRDKVELIWDDTGADHYAIYRSDLVDGNYQRIGETASRYSVYVDRGLMPNTSYFYQVREEDAAGNETCSSVIAPATTSLRGRPDSTPINVAPVFTSSPVTEALEDSSYTYILAASDANGDALSYSLITAPNGMQLSGGSISWVPTNAYVGVHTVVVRVSDAAGLFDDQVFTLTVSNTNDAPNIVSSAPISARVNEPYQYSVFAVDIDAGDTLSYSLIQGPAGMTVEAATGVINWTPGFTQQGDHLVQLRVTDLAGEFAEQAYTLTVDAVNNPPQITSTPLTNVVAGADYSYQLAFTDPDVGDVHEFSLVSGPTGSTVDANSGLFVWSGAIAGTHEVSLRVADYGGLIDTQTFTLTVSAPNNVPVISSLPLVDAVEQEVYQYDVVATDADGDALSYTLTTAPTGMTIDGSGTIRWTPAFDQVGSQSVVLSVSDSQDATTQSYTISVTARANTAPAITSTPLTTVIVDSSYSYQVIAQDAESDPVSYVLTASPAGMTISTSGLISWVADSTPGSHTVVIEVSDDRAAASTQTYELVVEPEPNNLPTISSVPLTGVTAGEVYQYQIVASDPDGDTLGYSLTTAPVGMVIGSTTGLINWTPGGADIGSHTVTVEVNDGNGGVATQSYSLTVTEQPNNLPVITSNAVINATEGTAYSYDVDATDADGDMLAYSLTMAPSGMIIDTASGLIQWTPIAAQVGDNLVTVQVEDGNGGVAIDSFNITVAALPNVIPVFTSTPLLSAVESTLYTYAATATDADGDVLAYSLSLAPSGMLIDAASGVVSWTPNASQVGSHSVTIVVNDGQSGSETQTYTLTVSANTNQVPEIVSVPTSSATVGQPYQYDVVATDADGDSISYSLETAPAGMLISAGTGQISWTPVQAQAGSHTVTVRASDSSSFVTQTFLVSVTEFVLPLDVLISVSPQIADPGQTVVVNVSSEGGEGARSVSVTHQGSPLALTNGQAQIIAGSAGRYDLVATVSDSEQTLTSEAFYTVRDSTDTSAPVVSITSPATDTSITDTVPVIGTASDANLASYRLVAVLRGGSDSIEISTGNGPVVDAQLGTIDPTSMPAGLYDLILQATDINGSTVSDSIVIDIAEDVPVGNFSMTLEDMSVPLAGISVSVKRTYDSRIKHRDLDFGYGWTIDYQDVSIQENQRLGQNWTLTSSGGFFTTYCVEPVGDHYVKIRLPGQRSMKFNVVPNNNCQLLIPPTFINVSFSPAPGTQGTLSASGSTGLYYAGGQLLESSLIEVFDPSAYTLTTATGHSYYLDENFGIRYVEDTNGNRVTFSSSGITHSNGVGVAFTRDGHGRITEVTDPAGDSVSYAYNAKGDLAAVTDREGNRVEFRYNRSHGLVEVIDPLGQAVARNIYDDSGRIVQIIDADGNTVDFEHNEASNTEVVRDQNGNPTIFSYSDSGDVLSETDALGNTKSFTYDSSGNRTSITDALGYTKTIAYDSNGNPTTETDPLGNQTVRSFSATGVITSITDANGNTTANTLDSRGNVLSSTDPLGNSSNSTYDSSGNLTSTTDKLGNVTSMALDSSGRVLSRTNPLGDVESYTYDGNGKETSNTRQRTNGTGVLVDVITHKEYDRNGRVTAEIDAEGGRTEFVFNASGQLTDETNPRGFTTRHFYDISGNKVRTEYADGSSETFAYDIVNNKTSETDRGGRTTSFTYDTINRLVRTTYNDGSFIENGYDAVGNVVSETDENGNVTRYEFDEAGRKTAQVDALGNRLEYSYDSNSNLIAQFDALGRVTGYEYDLLDRRIATVFADGTEKRTTLDAVGQIVSEVDQAGNSTSFSYDSRGKLTAVTDALGGITAYEYDELGNLIRQTDAEGRIKSWDYDNASRVIAHALPDGSAESFAYDVMGNKIGHTDFAGRYTQFEYDSNNRLLSKTFDDGSIESFTYTPTGQVASTTDLTGTSTYGYDDRDRLTSVIHADGSFINYTYDAAGNKLSVETPLGVTTYTYDALNRLSDVTDRLGEITRYSYDEVGNRAAVSYANSTSTSYVYDSLDRLISVSQLASDGSVLSNQAYTLGAAGNRVQVTESSGRTVDYQYDSLYRLLAEQITDPLNGNINSQYSYDRVGNRLTQDTNGAVVNYSYDDNDRLLQKGAITYAYDANGNRVSQTGAVNTTSYVYDHQNRLIAVTTPSLTASYRYDALGNRREAVTNGSTSKYLVDPTHEHAQVLAELDGADQVVAEYVIGDDLISQRRPTSGVSYYHYDGTGSTRLLTDVSGNATNTYTYEAFGNVLNSTGSVENDFLYTGEQYDPNTGFYYLRARYYDAATGRFVSADPFPGWKFDPPSLHKYNYVHNDPVNKVDPSGKFVSIGFIGGLTRGIFGALRAIGPAFAISRTLGGIALRNLGMVVESAVGRILARIPGVVMTNGIRLVGNGGPRVIDFWAKVGQRVALIEVKYQMPARAGAALTRLVGQMRTAISAGEGAQVVLFTFRAPSAAQMNLLLSQLGAEASAIQHVSGLWGLVQWARFFFLIP